MAHEDVELNIMGEIAETSEEMKKEVEELCSASPSVVTYSQYQRDGWGKYSHQPTLFGNVGQQTSLIEKDLDLGDIITLVDETNERVCKGEWSYGQWRKAIREANKALKGTGYKIIEFKKANLENEIMYINPVDMITYNGELVSSPNAGLMPDDADDLALYGNVL